MKISEVVEALTNIKSQIGDLEVICGKNRGANTVNTVIIKEVDIRDLSDPIHAMDEDTFRVVFVGHAED